LNLPAADPGNPARLHHLAELSRWRNIAAHHRAVPPAGLPSLVDLQAGGIPATVWPFRSTGSCTIGRGIEVLRSPCWIPTDRPHRGMRAYSGKSYRRPLNSP
jgi:hypothetical protein